jgi:hypothetical protein
VALDARQEVLGQIPEEHLNELRTLIGKRNAARQETGGDFAVTEAGVWRGEHGYLAVRWYGWELGMDSFLAGKVLAGVFEAGAACTAIGIGGGEPAFVIAAAFGLLGPFIMTCKHEDGWTYIHMLGMPPFTPGGLACNTFG